MSCSCGHDHENIDVKDFENAVETFLKGMPENFDMDAEYELIKKKVSKLSRMQRDAIVALVEYKKEHFNTDYKNTDKIETDTVTESGSSL